MIKKVLLGFCLFLGFIAQAQINSKEFRSKKIQLKKDTIYLEKEAINPLRFKILDSSGVQIPKSAYQIDFSKALLIISAKKYPIIQLRYFIFPEFITKTYQSYNDSVVVPNTNNTQKLYSLTSNKNKTNQPIFDGLTTNGSINRGLTIGNNQNSVVNSSLDLNIEGYLSKEVKIRANIFDTNIPLQDNGYSQNITDFDRIFIELTHKNWRVKAGDLDLKNTDSYFLKFSKKVSGLELEAKNENLNVLASGAIVRGRFSVFNFNGREGNQGPYKITGPNSESFLIIVGGSDALFMNGQLLTRGEDKDYTIDYNTAEIRFNTSFPINSDMRFRLEFQYSERNYTRFVSYNKAKYSTENWYIQSFFYNEIDAKNQPLQQDLSDAQKLILSEAGNNPDKMISESAYREAYSDSKILYKKTLNSTSEIFEYSEDPTDELYYVSFSLVGNLQGAYRLSKTTALGNIYEYVGLNAGDYSPVIRLIAPSKSQIFAINTAYHPSKKTQVFAEWAMSNNDLNLFSSIDNQQNKGVASKIDWTQLLVDSNWRIASEVSYEFVQQNFKMEQRFETVEFQRDWNLSNPIGDKQQIGIGLQFKKAKNITVDYGFQQLSYGQDYKGYKQLLKANSLINKTALALDASYLNSTSSLEKNSFIRTKAKLEQSFTKKWIGAFADFESNQKRDLQNNQLQKLSHRYSAFDTYIGAGDSTKVYVKFGVNYRVNDSVRNAEFAKINTRSTFYLESKLIENSKTNLAVFANYMNSKNSFVANEKSLNAKVVYNQKLFGNFINSATVYETSSGNVPRQEYIYVQTEPGLGYYTWIDYNNNGIKEFNEFEIAIFQDQANYLRIALPNINYVNTQRAKWSQSIQLNPSAWSTKKGLRKIISHFYNQSAFLIDNEQERSGSLFNLNPFHLDETKLIGLNLSLRNQFYFNKNNQHYSFIYTYQDSKIKQFYSIGNQESKNTLHQLDFEHMLTKFWLLELKTSFLKEEVNTENFSNRNYLLNNKEFGPKFTFLYNKNHRFSLSYLYKDKKNTVQDFEKMEQQNIGASYLYSSKKNNQLSVDLNLYSNNFSGNANSPVAYQMLEGLQVGKNYTWSLLYQQKLNSFLNLNINYLGRKSERSSVIHTGSIQLRADF
ncbi:hypothetical protein GCM10011416_05080 [Polaribacter pacificus]|uniref:Uncharacterized protein n=1 Tax=Polaribacter pacificus TaxID=1775173 RepID=A0A917HUN4_9FLAO|nr:hypothetical protein [Polaribacter pacificus]GGG91436.1 hypothetical protein GCM10011416_05080 [Polaribacter pacificus]